MLRVFRKIFRSGKNDSAGNSGSRHLKKLLSGPKVIIDGKVYVRVKLRFVDTLDFSTTQFVDRLETEIESQKAEIERLTTLLTSREQMITNLQALNVNLNHEIRLKPANLTNKITELTSENERISYRIVCLEKEVNDLRDRNRQLKGSITKAENIFREKDNKIRKLEQSVCWIDTSDKEFRAMVNSKVRLKKELNTAESKIKSLENQIDEKTSAIQILSKRVQERENRVSMLETLLNKKEKATPGQNVM